VYAPLRRLIERTSRLWAGEAEVIRTYFESPRRSRESDLRWIARQAYKEIWDGVAVQLGRLECALRPGAGQAEGDVLDDAAEVLRSELAHYRVFAGLHAALAGAAAPPLEPAALRERWSWPENDALRAVRASHVERFGGLGRRAMRFTEGGYARLFAEGMRLRGRGGADDLVAEACARVFDDEFEHMLGGIGGLAAEGLAEEDWRRLEELAAEQMRARIHMRSAQFDAPLPAARIAELCAGACSPLDFDYERAERAAQADRPSQGAGFPGR
jgi:hypothetical protein